MTFGEAHLDQVDNVVLVGIDGHLRGDPKGQNAILHHQLHLHQEEDKDGMNE